MACRGSAKPLLVGIMALVVMVTSTHSNKKNVTTPLDMFWGIQEFKDHYDLPKLPYPTNALEPWIEEKTLIAHHNGHLAKYTAKMNAVLHEWRKSVRCVYFVKGIDVYFSYAGIFFTSLINSLESL